MVDITEIEKIVGEIFALGSPSINAAKQGDIGEFLKINVNGDSIKSYLVISANFSKDRSGALVYILTDARLIEISVKDTGEIESSSFKLETMVGVSRKLDEGKMQVRVAFQGDKTVGLRYPITNNKITDFFQKIDQEQAESGNGAGA